MWIARRCALLWLVVGCASTAEKKCLHAPADQAGRVSACGEACDQGNQEACTTQTQLAKERCFEAKDTETCRWMCLYASSGQGLYCAEYERLTGKPLD